MNFVQAAPSNLSDVDWFRQWEISLRLVPVRLPSVVLSNRENDHRPYHAQVVMKSTEIMEGTWGCKGRPEPRHARRCLGKTDPVLARRANKP